MIIGDGLIASILKNKERDCSIVYFASGVSSSAEWRESEFLRESSLLRDVLKANDRVVYFSSCFAGLPSEKLNRYLKHKVEMENIVLSFDNTTVLRLPNIVHPGGNQENLINRLIRNIVLDEEFTICPYAKRNLVDVEMLSYFICEFEKSNNQQKLYNVCSSFTYRLDEIVQEIEGIVGKKAHYKNSSEFLFNFPPCEILLNYEEKFGATKQEFLANVVGTYVNV